jgi:hypothetical protein
VNDVVHLQDYTCYSLFVAEHFTQLLNGFQAGRRVEVTSVARKLRYELVLTSLLSLLRELSSTSQFAFPFEIAM